jgi:TolB-like protein/tetratricopeptide (TPR) repeat protein
MAADKAFLLPVVVDDTGDDDERVPERFREVQWTRLPGGETPRVFVQRMQRLLSPEPPTTSRPATGGVATAPAIREPSRASWWSKPATRAIVAALGSGLVSFVAYKFWSPKHVTEAPTAPSAPPATAPATTAAAFSPPPHSIAVLPFVNMSGDTKQEYFSDGLTEELLNSLAAINELHVAARTSAFSFKGKDADIGTIARKLNVGSILEGSVRRSGHTVRVTTQLVDAATGFHLWSHIYDRDLSDVLKLQTDIATAVTSALKVTLLADTLPRIELGGTRNPVALDAYLRAENASSIVHNAANTHAAIAELTEAVGLDPNYALAFAERAMAFRYLTQWEGSPAQRHDLLARAQTDAHRAITLAPDLALGHLALAVTLKDSLDFTGASEEYERAVALSPGNGRILRGYGNFASLMGRTDAGIAAGRRAVALDPINPLAYEYLAGSLMYGRRYDEAIATLQHAVSLNPHESIFLGNIGDAYYAAGDFQAARTMCEKDPVNDASCLVMVYDKLGRHADAEAEFAKLRASDGDGGAYEYAQIYAQWGDLSHALSWLETAVRLRDPGLVVMKMDQLLDPLRNEPRFQAIERELKFPE